MGRIFTLCTALGSLAAGVVWLIALVQLVEWYQDSNNACLPSADSHLSLRTFCTISLTATGLFFLLFFLQLFYHDRLAHEVLLEDLADAAATVHFPSVLSTLCSSFTHTLVLLFNILITLTFVLLCFLGLLALSDDAPSKAQERESWLRTCEEPIKLVEYVLVLDFLGACMFFVATGWRCINRCWTDEDAVPTTNGRSSGGGSGGVGGLIRAAAEGRGGDKKGKGGRKGNVKYSAVEGEDEEDADELFDADALDGGSDSQSDIQRGSMQLTTVAEDEVEMMDMLTVDGGKHAKPIKPIASKDSSAATAAGGVVVGGKSVPSILPPPRVSEEGEEKDESRSGTMVGLPGDEDTDADDYDYADVDEGEEDEQKQK